MTLHRTLTLSLAAVVLAACAESESPVAPDPLLSSVGSGHRVIGSGHTADGSGLREFTFHALEQEDGSAKGSYKVVLPNGLFFEADVTCMAVEGDTGWVAGVIRDTNAGIIVLGSTTMFWARDGGEGEGATDIVSTAAINRAQGADLQFCAERSLELPPRTVIEGNVQVR